jgi:hypothetical protein
MSSIQKYITDTITTAIVWGQLPTTEVGGFLPQLGFDPNDRIGVG